MRHLSIILLISCLFGVGIASAETGNVTVTDQSILSYTINDGAGTAGSVMNQIYLDTTDYNEWESFHINVSLQSPTFALDSETTQFTCSAGGTCSGYVWYVKAYQKIYFAFTSLTVTSSPITLSYTKNILANVTGMTRIKTDCTPSITQPILLYKETVVTPRCLGGLYGSVTVDSTTTDHYVVTYPFGNAFTLNVTKGGSINDHWLVYDVDGNIYMDGTMDKLNFALTNNSYNGIIANVSIPSGASTVVTINVSGTSAAVTPPVVGTGGSTSGQITYSASSIAVGQSYGINTSISNANFSTGRTYYIYAYDTSDNLITGFPIEITTQTHSTGKFWSFSSPGTYNATLKYCDNLVFTCTLFGINRVEIDTAYAYVPVPTYNYSITTDKNSYIPGETVVFTVSNPSPVKVYFDVFEDTIDTGLGVPTFGLNTEIAAGSSTSISKLIPDNMKLGNYTAYLVSSPLTSETVNILTSKAFNISAPSSTSNTIFIGWDRDSYTLGDTGKLTTVSDYNNTIVYVVSPGGDNKTYLFPLNSTNITMIALDEIGQWIAKLTNNSGVVTYANTTVFAGAPVGNETFANCLFNKNYACWNSLQYEQGDAYRIDFRLEITPLNSYFPVLEIINPSGETIFNQSINLSSENNHVYTGSMSGSFTPQATTGVYYARIVTEDISRNRIIKASSATEVIQKTSIPTPTPDIETNTNNLLAGPFLTIIIVLLAFAGIGLELGGGIGSIMGFGSGFIVLSVIGLMPLWAVFLFAVIAITAFAVMAGKQFSGGGND